MLIHDRFYCEGRHYYNQFYNIAIRLSKRKCVKFALYCAKDVFHLVEGQDKEVVKRCFNLVEKWLIDEKSVTNEELSNAAYGDNAASQAAAYTSVAAAYAPFTYAANAVTCAYCATASDSNKLNEYLIIANSYLTKTTINCPNYEIEGKILYLIDELDENIILYKDKYYVNMNGIENCPEYGFDTQQELLNELFNSKCLFWEFVRNWLDQLYKNQQA